MIHEMYKKRKFGVHFGGSIPINYLRQLHKFIMVIYRESHMTYEGCIIEVKSVFGTFHSSWNKISMLWTQSLPISLNASSASSLYSSRRRSRVSDTRWGLYDGYIRRYLDRVGFIYRSF